MSPQTETTFHLFLVYKRFFNKIPLISNYLQKYPLFQLTTLIFNFLQFKCVFDHFGFPDHLPATRPHCRGFELLPTPPPVWAAGPCRANPVATTDYDICSVVASSTASYYCFKGIMLIKHFSEANVFGESLHALQ